MIDHVWELLQEERYICFYFLEHQSSDYTEYHPSIHVIHAPELKISQNEK